MRILFLDPYKKSRSRISKDTSGGYGTENDLGDGFFGRFLSNLLKRSIFWPSLPFVQLFQELLNEKHTCVYIKTHKAGPPKGVENYDFIFICSSIVCFETEVNMSKKLLEEGIKAKIFFCGTVAEHLRNQIPRETTILSGNYEFLLQYLKNSGTSLKKISERSFLKVPNGNPESLSTIDWSENGLPKNKHSFYANRKSFFPLIFTRGCPYSCFEYCTYPLAQGRKSFHEEIESFVAKLKEYEKKFKHSHIIFRDPVFSINLKKAKMLLKAIGDNKLSLSFSAELHLKNLDEEFIQLCKYANVTLLKFGIESALEEVRNNVNRFSVSNDQQRSMIKKLKLEKIRTHGMFILAQPEDDEKSCMKTIEYACSLELDIAQFSIFTPYPGTPYYAKNFQHLNYRKYEDFNQFQLVFNHPNISFKQSRKLLEKAYFYFLITKFLNKLGFRILSKQLFNN